MASLDVHTTKRARAGADFKWPELLHPDGDRIRLNKKDFVAIDRASDATYDAIYRPQALYNVATNGFHANNGAFLFQEVATNLPIYRDDTGPTDFHLHLPPGGFQFVMVTSGVFAFDYDGRVHYVGPGSVILQSAIVHRQHFYTWSGLGTEENLRTPQTAVPDPASMGYSGKFLEAFITAPADFPNPSIVTSDHIKEDETPRMAWCHPLHNRPNGAAYWCQDPLALDATYRKLTADMPCGPIKSPSTVYVRDLGLTAPSGRLATGHIIATDNEDGTLLPKSGSAYKDADDLCKGKVVVYRVIRGTAKLKVASGKVLKLEAGDTVTVGADKGEEGLVGLGADTQVLRLGLLKNIEKLNKWTPTQRDEIDALGGKIITRTTVRPLRTSGKAVGYLY